MDKVRGVRAQIRVNHILKFPSRRRSTKFRYKLISYRMPLR